MTRAKYRAECNAVFQADATESVAKALTDTAHEHPQFTAAIVLERLGRKDKLAKTAFDTLVARAIGSGAIRAEGAGAWSVVDEDELCDTIYRFGRAA